jgi:hypothetical protein
MSSTIPAMRDDLLTNHDTLPAAVLGTTLLENIDDRYAGRTGRYRAVINSVTYTFCGIDREGARDEIEVTYTPASGGPVCRIPFSVTDGYFLQK